MELEPDFSEFCSLLNAHRVEFVIVGAYALAFHGAPRYTGDIDFLVRPTEDNGKRLLDAIAEFGFPTTPVTSQDIVNWPKGDPNGRPARPDPCNEPGRLGELDVQFIGQAEFLTNKRAAGREKDLADIEALRLKGSQ